MEPGVKTSEFKLTALIVILGTVLDSAGLLLEAFKDSGASPSWLPVVLVVVGTGLALFKSLGYTRSRTLIKLAALKAPATEVAKVLLPLAEKAPAPEVPATAPSP